MTAATGHYVILGVAAFPAGQVESALAAAGVELLDEMPSRALLVAGREEAIRSACAGFPGVRIVPERTFKLGA